MSAFALPLACLTALPRAFAQAPTANEIEGIWQGTLHSQKDLRLILKISKAPDGSLRSIFYSIDERGQPIPAETTTLTGSALTIKMDAMDGAFVGKVAPDNTTIAGEWPQGDKPLPLILVRVTADTAWSIPEPPPKVQPMDPKASPSFEVATIKLSDPASQGKGFGGPPGKFMTHNTTLDDLLMFAYQLQTKQIINAPGWAESEKFDIVGKQDTPGQANEEQMRGMMQKLLVSRFGLKFHMDKKELPAFILSVAKGGPKLKASTEDPNYPSAFFFRQLGDLTFRNISMEGFSKWMQTVLDRPVVNHTDLQGHFDGRLKWNPDESQFAVFGIKVVHSDAPDAPPDLYKAIQDQIGLRLDAGKPNVDVMVVDHVEKPSEN
ncbi:MAG: TIGR03435 family protein [Janthinobacterium lividum]